MAKFKEILKSLFPPIIFSLSRKIKGSSKDQPIWFGDFNSWDEVKIHCTGYDSELILNKCKESLLKVKNGEAAYERDSMLFDEIQYSWNLLAVLQNAALKNDGRLCVLDFGGSLGSTYYQNRAFLSPIKSLSWCIVEQARFVDCGRENFEDEQLKFYYTIEDCMAVFKPDVLILSSVLQYMEKPDEIIEKILKLGIPYIILDRLALSDEDKDILTVQKVSDRFYKSKLAHWFFSYRKLFSKFVNNYDLMASSPSVFDGPVLLNDRIKCHFSFFAFKKKSYDMPSM